MISINKITRLIPLLILATIIFACEERDIDHTHDEDGMAVNREGESVLLSELQFNALKMEVGEIPLKSMSGTIQVNGILEVPPQNEAVVTAIVGANIISIHVIEGDEVKKGQVLAYIAHPDLIRLQSEYLEHYNNSLFTAQEYQRQTRLYQEEVGSGKVYQQVQAEYNASQGLVKSLESQLRLLGINPKEIQEGNFLENVAIRSPINGSIVDVLVKNGQYAPPEKELFEIINTDHIHLKLMVFERDVHRLEKGQRVRFSLSANSNQELDAEIFSISRKFDHNTKTVQVHAEILEENLTLVPGMYVKGNILTQAKESHALPEAALVREGNKLYAFIAEESPNNTWQFTPSEVITGESIDGWVGVTFLKEISSDTRFALNNGYYIMAEMKKGELEHDH